MSEQPGWPVLVAAGRRRDYSTLLAPDFLVTAAGYGILIESMTPLHSGIPIGVAHAGPRPLTVVYAMHHVTEADIGGTGTTPLRDVHSRPLRFLYGFVCLSDPVSAPARADLDRARVEALHVYRQFLDAEEAFAVIPSRPYPLSTPLAVPDVRPPATRTPTLWLAGAVVAVVVLALLVVLLLRPGRTDHTHCPGTTATSTGIGTPSPSGTCASQFH